MVVSRIPISMAAGTRRASSAEVASKPNTASSVCGSRTLPNVTKVAGCGTIKPALWNPMKAMNRPTPAATAAYNSNGMAATINCRMPTAVRIRKATPETNTAPKAACQGIPMPLTTV